MTKVQIRQQARVGEIFAPEAFDHLVGQPAPLKVAGEPVGHATVVDAVVADDGLTVDLTIEAPDIMTPAWAWEITGPWSLVRWQGPEGPS